MVRNVDKIAFFHPVRPLQSTIRRGPFLLKKRPFIAIIDKVVLKNTAITMIYYDSLLKNTHPAPMRRRS